LQADLIGQQCYEIDFVNDYVIVGFDDWSLVCASLPVVTIDGDTFGQSQAGWRDALCALIGTSVQAVNRDADRWIKIQFSNGARLDIEPMLDHLDWKAWFLRPR
jgi:hypothetical protein